MIWNLLRHQACNERNVAGQSIELRYHHRALALAGGLEGGSELRSAIERIGTLASLDLDELTGELHGVVTGEPGDRAREPDGPTGVRVGAPALPPPRKIFGGGVGICAR
jgi:hypothetical protein